MSYTFSAILSLALLALGLDAVSPSPDIIGFFVNTFKRGFL
jgi:hypothetical protein